MHRTTRRDFFRTASLGMALGVGGCLENTTTAETTDTVPGARYPVIAEWLNHDEIGGNASGYYGNVVDRRDRDSVTVELDGFTFKPAALLASPETTIQWRWVTHGENHNVVADPGHQLGKSDYEFHSGRPVSIRDSDDSTGTSEGDRKVKFTRTLDEEGIALYHCDPHLSLGMKGGIAVE